MKKLISILIVLALSAAMFACAGGSAGNNSETSQSPEGASDSPASESAGSESKNESAPEPEQPSTDENSASASQDTGTSQADQTPVEGTDGLAFEEDFDSVIVTGLGTCAVTDIVIPSHVNGKPVVAIDEEAFEETNVTSVVIPWTVKKVDEDAFAGCESLVSAEFSEGLEYVSEGAFFGCMSLKKIELPASLYSVGHAAFRGCASLESVSLKGSTIIWSNAFTDCISMKTFEMTNAGGYGYDVSDTAFQGCTALETVRFAEGLGVIGGWNFSDDKALKTIYLPKSLTRVKACAFLRSGLEKVFYAGSEDEWKQIDVKGSNEPLLEAEIEYNYAG